MAETLLSAQALEAGYGPADVLHGVGVSVSAGEVACLLGANGAGKTTLLRTLSGIISARHGQVLLDGRDITHAAPEARVRRGLCQVPEGRHLFPSLTVLDNLELGGFTAERPFRGRAAGKNLDSAFSMFPVLFERRQQLAGSLSGGEQQMLAIGRALMARPRVLLLDEPTLGLAPVMAQRIFSAIVDLARDGLAILLAEQNATKALAIAQRGYIVERGQITLEGAAAELSGNPEVATRYLGG